MKLRLTCNTISEKEEGLRAIDKLAEDEYALFIYVFPHSEPFWNKGVSYPIDIGFFDDNKNLIFKTTMNTNQRSPVYSPKPYNYVVETNEGKLAEKFAF